MVRCIMKGCTAPPKHLHVFPPEKNRFDAWVAFVGEKDLDKMSQAEVRQKKLRICSAHFSADDYFEGQHNRSTLKRNSVPTIYHSTEDNEEFRPSKECAEEYHETMDLSEEEVVHGYDQSAPIPDFKIASYQVPCNYRGTDIIHSRKKLGFRSNVPLLRAAGVTRKRHLHGKELQLYNIAAKTQKWARYLQSQNQNLRERLKQAQKFETCLEKIEKRVNATTYSFIKLQVGQQHKKPRGRRFTLDDKIFALSLMKQSPKLYRHLKKTFALPSRKVLMKVLSLVPFDVGISTPILDSLRESVQKIKCRRNKISSLMFDEVALTPGLWYNETYDRIDGFHDTGDGNRQLDFADHAMVLMAKGIFKKWKQPLAYYFVKHSMCTADLKAKIKEGVRALHDVGLTCIASVCDQGNSNGSAVRELLKETKQECLRRDMENRMFGFSIDGAEVIPLFDVPHLLKCVRNNMMTNDYVWFQWRNGWQRAYWKYVVQLFEEDAGDYDFRMLNKLTERHVHQKKMKKMKVSIAAQVFSQRVSATMRKLAKDGTLPEEAIGTADFLLFIDKLFDSCNGSKFKPEYGKELRCAISKSSAHLTFWTEAVGVLETLKFVSIDGKRGVPPCIRNWIHTLQGLRCIWQKMSKESDIKFVKPRELNQDPLENFFGAIRSQACRDVCPNHRSFSSSFRSLIINNFASPHSPDANCEEDSSQALNTLKHFLCGREKFLTSVPTDIGEDLMTTSLHSIELSDEEKKPIVKEMRAFIGGYVAKKLLKSIGVCKQCRGDLIDNGECRPPTDAGLIIARSYKPSLLLHPTSNFMKLFSQCCEILHIVLPEHCLQESIMVKLTHVLKSEIGQNIKTSFHCRKHTTFDLFLKFFVKFYVLTWIKNINRILRGIDNSRLNVLNDKVKILAHKRFVTHSKRTAAVKAAKQLV